MFPSLSKCVPATLVRSTFTADKTVSISASSGIQFFINGSPAGSSLTASAGAVISAQVTSPQNFSDYAYFNYTLNQVAYRFAVVTEHQITPLFLTDTLRKRWYDFQVNDEHEVTYYDGTFKDIRSLGYNTRPFNPIEIKSDSIIVDHSPNNFLIQQFDKISLVKESTLESWSAGFDGSSHIRIDTSNDLTFGTGDFTIELHIKLAASPKKRSLVTNYSKFNKNSWFNFFIDENNRLCFECNNSTVTPETKQVLQGSQQLLTNNWYTVAVSRQNGNVYTFINGVQESSGSILTEIQKGFTYIGRMPYDTAYDNFSGNMRSLRISKGEALYTANYIPNNELLGITASTELLIFQDDPDYDLNLNVIPDPNSKKVFFYDIYGQLVDDISFPVKPVMVEKFTTPGKKFFVVSCSDRSLYMVTVTRDSYRKIVLISTRDEFQLDWLFELPYETDIPFRGSFLAYARFKRAQGERNSPNCISVANGKIWVGGYGRVWVLDKNFNILDSFSTPRLVNSIQSLGDSCLAVLSNGKVRHIDSVSRTSTTVYSGLWMGNIAVFNGFAYVADSIKKQLVKIDVANPLATAQTVSVGNFCPSYIAANSSNLYVAGHDSNIVLQMGINNAFERIVFDEKVTWVSAINQYIFASHYLKNVNTLKLGNTPSILPFTIPPITCGFGPVCTPPQKMRILGAETASPLFPLGSQNLSWRVDGKVGGVITNGSYFSVGTITTQLTQAQFPIIIGDCAFDFIIDSSVDSALPRYFYFPPVLAQQEVTQIDFTLPSSFSESYASIEYGEIKRNFNTYTGQSKLKANDVFSISIPLNQSDANFISVLTVGSRIFYVPINSQPVETVSVIENNVPRYAYVSQEIYVTASGEYQVPYYDDSYKQVYLPISSSTITNLGGAFDSTSDLPKLNDDDDTNNAFVPAANGLFDVYVDLETSVIVNGFVIYNNIAAVDVARPPNTIFIGPPPPSDFRYLAVPRNIRISASNSTTNWNVIATFNNIPNDLSFWVVGANEFNFANSISYRYWRFENTSTQNSGVAIAEMVFKAFIPGTIVRVDGAPLYPGTQTILEGQYLEISMAASSKLADEARMIIVGPKNYELRVITKPIKSINYINVGVITSNVQRSTHYFHDITVTGPLPAKLVSPNPYLSFSIDGGLTYSETVTINSTAQKLSIRKKLISTDETSAVFYQELVDSFYDETYLTEIGKILIGQDALEAVNNNVDIRENNVYTDLPISSRVESFADYSIEGLLTSFEKYNKPVIENLSLDAIIPSSINSSITQGIIYRARRSYPSIFAIQKGLSNFEINNVESSLRGPSVYGETNPLITVSHEYFFYILPDVHEIYNFLSLTGSINNLSQIRFPGSYANISNINATYFLSSLQQIENVSTVRFPGIQLDISVIYDTRFPIALVDITALYQSRYPTALVAVTSVFQSPYPIAQLVINTQYFNSYEYFNLQSKIARILRIEHDIVYGNIRLIGRIQLLIDRIPLISISRISLNIHRIQFRIINKFSYIDGLPRLFLYNESTFYGFYDTEQDAAIAAVNAGHVPFIVYNVPSSSKFTYRRTFGSITDCSIFPDGKRPRERLIQGG